MYCRLRHTVFMTLLALLAAAPSRAGLISYYEAAPGTCATAISQGTSFNQRPWNWEYKSTDLWTIGCDKDSTGNMSIWRHSPEGRWQQMPGRAIAVTQVRAPDGPIYVLSNNPTTGSTNLWQWNISTLQWNLISGAAAPWLGSISGGNGYPGDPPLWVIDQNVSPWSALRFIEYWDGASWHNMNRVARQVSRGFWPLRPPAPTGATWWLYEDGVIRVLVDTQQGLQLLPGCGLSIDALGTATSSIGRRAMVLGCDGKSVWQWQNVAGFPWTPVATYPPGTPASEMFVQISGDWALNNQGKIYKLSQ
jgi:hypothetical protein